MSNFMKTAHDIKRAQREITDALGQDVLDDLHKEQPLFDWIAVVFSWSAFGALIYLLGKLPFGPWFVVCCIAQAFVLLSFAYQMHDIWLHRRIGGRGFSHWAALVSGMVAFQLAARYARLHPDHHRYVNTDADEEYKLDLDTRWKRWLFMTPIGYLLTFRGHLRRERSPKYPSPEGSFAKRPLNPRQLRLHKVEKTILRYFWGVLAILLILFPRFVGLGYLLPLAVMLPIANGIRIILEHAEVNPENMYHCATYYRTGPVTRPLFFWGAGDCHLVHHIFPEIPWYRLGKACDLMRPFLIDHGVRERRSLPKLLYGYFVKGEPYRALWNV